MNTIMNDFLHKIQMIKEKYKTINELSLNRFNIFSVLGVESKEVRMHSALIGELLNPKGSHNFGTIFLSEFLKIIEIDNIDSSSARIFIERHIGKISEDRTMGGNIDIYIESKFGSIIIENKIYAIDQDSQLLRYYNFNPKAVIVYLTLYGKPASKASLGTLNDNEYICVSYSHHIVRWLERCVELSARSPYVRETLNQYCALVKGLTNQTNSREELMELIDEVLRNENNIMSFLYLHKNATEVFKKLNDRIIDVAHEVSKELDAQLLAYNKPLIDRYSGFTFVFNIQPNIPIRFEFEDNNMRSLITGFCQRRIDKYENEVIQNRFKAKFPGFKETSGWPAYEFWNEYQDWNDEKYKALLDGTFKRNLSERMHKFKEIIEDCKEFK